MLISNASKFWECSAEDEWIYEPLKGLHNSRGEKSERFSEFFLIAVMLNKVENTFDMFYSFLNFTKWFL